MLAGAWLLGSATSVPPYEQLGFQQEVERMGESKAVACPFRRLVALGLLDAARLAAWPATKIGSAELQKFYSPRQL